MDDVYLNMPGMYEGPEEDTEFFWAPPGSVPDEVHRLFSRLAGFEVQHLMAFGTPEEVKEEAEFLLRIYDRPAGRLMMTMGNASTPDWKRENLDALYQASLEYDNVHLEI